MSYNAETVPDLLSPDGPLARDLTAYEDRPFQREFVLEVARLLEEGGRLAAEAPTGIGKSLGYAVPAAAWAVAGNGPVIVSTHTKALQEQLLHLEAPRLRRVLDRDVVVRVLKGRTNYLCRRRYRVALGQASGEGTLALLHRIRPWVDGTETGDFAELGDLSPQDRQYLHLRAASEPGFCAHSGCLPGEGCFLKKARQQAAAAHILIVNHALLSIHLFGDRDLLPASDALIVDEAHGFVRAALDHLTVSVGPGRIAALLESLPGGGGFLPDAVRSKDGSARLAALHHSASGLESASKEFFGRKNGAPPDGDPRQRYRDVGEYAGLCPLSGDGLAESLQTVLADAEALEAMAERAAGRDEDDVGRGFLVEVRRFREEGALFARDLEALTGPGPDPDAVTWKEWGGNAFSLNRSPLELGTALAPVLRKGPSTVVFTSATLAAGKDFTYFAREVGLDGDLHTVSYPSPFSFPDQAVVLAVRRAPDPREPGWAETTADTLDRLLRRPGRKTMALFTSYRDLSRVHRILAGAAGYAVLAQEGAGEVPRLLEAFRAAPRALLLGTASFWEGIDLPGDDLEILVLTRLPFGVPTDPRFQARAERLEAEGKNPFTDLYLPEAVLRFKQGFGRLIRRRSDCGVVAVLDPRLVTKGYGRRFAGALPLPVTEAGDGADLAARAAAWWETHSTRGDAT